MVDKTLAVKVGVSVAAILGIVVLALRGIVAGPQAVDFVRWVLVTFLGGAALLGGLQSIGSALNGGTLPSTAAPPAPPAPPSSSSSSPTLPPVVQAAAVSLANLALTILLAIVVVGCMLAVVGCASSSTSTKRLENAADVSGYDAELAACRDLNHYPTPASYEACAKLADVRHRKAGAAVADGGAS